MKNMKKIYIDGGARIGESLDMFLNDRKDLLGCDVHFFECNDSHLEILTKIKEENKNYNFIVHSDALWSENGEMDFYISIDKWGDAGCTLRPEKREKLDLENPKKVKTIDFSEFLNQFNDDDYIIVKLDIEGAEYKVIERILETKSINKINELYIEWHDGFFGVSSEFLKNELSKLNIKIDNNWP
jgi:FkbM family methyltransferase